MENIRHGNSFCTIKPETVNSNNKQRDQHYISQYFLCTREYIYPQNVQNGKYRPKN